MKQYIVYKVQMGSDKEKSKALKVAAGQNGVSSVKIIGEEKDKVVVIGDEVDIVALAISLKSKVGYTRILSVKVLNENDNDNDNDNDESRYDERKQLSLTTSNYYPSRSNSGYYYPNNRSSSDYPSSNSYQYPQLFPY